MTPSRLAAYNRLALLDYLLGRYWLDSKPIPGDPDAMEREADALAAQLGYEHGWRPWHPQVSPEDKVFDGWLTGIPRRPDGSIDYEALPVLDLDEFERATEEATQ